jgi:hypothetical protein
MPAVWVLREKDDVQGEGENVKRSHLLHAVIPEGGEYVGQQWY